MKKQTQELVQEYIKCKNDPVYFIEHYIELETVGGNEGIKLYGPQKDFIQHVQVDHHVVVLKTRQTGISTVTQAYIVWICCFYKNATIGVVSKDGPEATDFCRKVMQMIRNLPAWIRPKFKKDTEQTFILDTGCKFHASQVNASKPQGLLRGKAVTFAVIDEAAHIAKIDDAYSGLALALAKSQNDAKRRGVPFGTIIISTPNKTIGNGKWYFNQWTLANQAGSIFKPVTVHWKQIKEFADDPTWYETQCRLLNNSKWKIQQELEMCFLAGEDSFLPSNVIELLNNVRTEPIHKMSLSGHELHLYSAPQTDRFYIIGVDTASQAGTDYSAIQVLDYINFDQVAEFKSKLRVDDFCEVIRKINMIYPNNMLVVESNSYGNQVVEYLTKDGNSYNMYRQRLKNVDSNKKSGSKYRYGIATTGQTRPLMMDALYTFITENVNNIKSQRTALELISLVRKGDRVESDIGENDDLSLALSFCCYVRTYDPPMGFPGVNSVDETLTSQITDIISDNFNPENNLLLPEIVNNDDMKVSKSQTLNNYNRIIHRHLKDNLHKIKTTDNGMIDISQFFEYNKK